MIGEDRKAAGKRPGTRRLPILLLAMLAGTTACHRSAAERRQRYFEAGNRYFEQERFAEAESEYNRAIQADPGFAEGYYRLGLAQLQEEHWTPAARSLARAIELAPDNLEARLRLGDLLVASTQYSEAAEQAAEVLRHDPQNARAHSLLGQVYLHGKQYADARSEFEQAVKLAPQDPSVYEDLGLAQLLSLELDAAERNFRKAVELKPGDPQVIVALANFYRSRRDPARAEQVLQQGMKQNPTAIALRLALADLYTYQVRPGDAKRVLDQVEADTRGFPDARRQVAEFYLQHNDPAPALDRYLALAKNSGREETPAKKIGECYLLLGRWPEAERWIDEHDKEHKDPDFRLLRARAYLGENRFREAASELQSLIKEAPEMPDAHFYLAQVSAQQEDRRAAHEALTEAVRIQPGYLPALLGLANLSLQENDPAVALQYAVQMIANNYWLVDAHLIAGSAYLLQGNLAAAESEFEIAVGLNPHNPSALERLGRALGAQGKYRDAEKAYQSSLAGDPAYALALSGLADSLVHQGRTSQARSRIEHQIALQPGAYQPQVVKGEFCIAQKDWGCAERSYRQALALNPYLVNAYLALAHIYAETDRYPLVVQEYEEARKRFPDYLPAYVLLGEVYEYAGDFDRARNVYEDALKIKPGYYLAQSHLALLYADHGGSLSEALELARQAKTEQPDDPNANDTLAWIYYKQGLYPAAIEVLEPAVAKNPKSAKFQFHLGMAYLAVGRQAQGRKTLQSALRLGLNAYDAGVARKAMQNAGS